MKNYYEECLEKINTLIENNENEAALKLLHVELSMPYIPEPFKTEFEECYHKVKRSFSHTASLFTNIEDIKEAIRGNQSQVAKALSSLETMNLRPVVEDVKEILQMEIDDLMKRFILMICVEQELSFSINMFLDNEVILINVEEIESPFKQEVYLNVYQDLIETLESSDPSFLSLCLEELNMNIMKSFPFVDKALTSDTIIQNVNGYLKRG